MLRGDRGQGGEVGGGTELAPPGGDLRPARPAPPEGPGPGHRPARGRRSTRQATRTHLRRRVGGRLPGDRRQGLRPLLARRRPPRVGRHRRAEARRLRPESPARLRNRRRRRLRLYLGHDLPEERRKSRPRTGPLLEDLRQHHRRTSRPRSRRAKRSLGVDPRRRQRRRPRRQEGRGRQKILALAVAGGPRRRDPGRPGNFVRPDEDRLPLGEARPREPFGRGDRARA
mmetsp:Transcript_21448/g.69020  ORF Transcript_21448/g.69020 Transcript_21448/m.69020 type:complete len:228 (+) Transcript_21448:375-1058(+)